MKELIMILILFLTVSCSNFSSKYKNEKIEKMAQEIINNPKLLYDFRNNYPEFIKKELYPLEFQDTIRLNEIVNQLEIDFKNPDNNLIMYYASVDLSNYLIHKFKNHLDSLSNESISNATYFELFGYSICNDPKNKCFNFKFLRYKENCYLLRLAFGPYDSHRRSVNATDTDSQP